jgi:DNA-binding transcriptional ArsR family regulator
MENQTLSHDPRIIRKAGMTLRAINHEHRLKILETIATAGKLTVMELYIKLRKEQSETSQHLRILREAGFVSTERDGKFVYYSVNSQWIETVNEISKSLIH